MIVEEVLEMAEWREEEEEARGEEHDAGGNEEVHLTPSFVKIKEALIVISNHLHHQGGKMFAKKNAWGLYRQVAKLRSDHVRTLIKSYNTQHKLLNYYN